MPIRPRVLRHFSVVLVAAATLAISEVARAHTGDGLPGHSHADFLSGFVHPFSGLDHLLAMLAVGLWSAQVAQPGRSGMLRGPLITVLNFALCLLAGAIAGMQGLQIPAVEPMVAASVIAGGLLLAMCWQVPALPALAGIGTFAFFHGFAHGTEFSAGSHSGVACLAGMLCATLLLQTAGLLMGWTLRGTRQWIARAAGAAIALSGACLLAGVN